MRRLLLSALAAGAAAALATPARANDAYTTRIEPRPFYGATVTIEAGVRVFRPLPSQRHVIINPGGQTPLNLGYQDTRITEESRSYNYHHYDGAPYADGDRQYGIPYGYGARGLRGRHDRGYAPLNGRRHHHY